MAVLVAPTKSNLMKAKSALSYTKGFELLDKRNVLIREMMELMDKAQNIQGKSILYLKRPIMRFKL